MGEHGHSHAAHAARVARWGDADDPAMAIYIFSKQAEEGQV